jgi:hypothetical protein
MLSRINTFYALICCLFTIHVNIIYSTTSIFPGCLLRSANAKCTYYTWSLGRRVRKYFSSLDLLAQLPMQYIFIHTFIYSCIRHLLIYSPLKISMESLLPIFFFLIDTVTNLLFINSNFCH